MIVRSAVLAIAMAGASAAHANDLLLAPGKSVIFVDAAQPEVRIVVTAPGDRALNLSRLMLEAEATGVSSLATAVQVPDQHRVRKEPDGTLVLEGQATGSQSAGEEVPDGAVLVLDQGKFTVHRDAAAAFATLGLPEPRVSQPERNRFRWNDPPVVPGVLQIR
jgi:hypothetical protein